MNKHIHKAPLSIFACLIFVGIAFGQAKYEEIIDKADALIKAKNYVEAFSAAQQAIKLEPGQFTGYYYAAFALYNRGLLDEAEPFAKEAVTRATVTDKQTAQKLLDSIIGNKVAADHIRIADQALRDGVINKAAVAYTRAFEANRSQVDVGMKAAELWMNQLDNVLEAARIWGFISRESTNPAHSEKAKGLFKTNGQRIADYFESERRKADGFIAGRQYEEARATLSSLLAAYSSVFDSTGKPDPYRQTLHLKLMSVYAKLDRDPEAISEFALVLKTGKISVQDLLTTEYLDILVFDPKFQDFVSEALGDKQSQLVKDASNYEGSIQNL